MIAVDRVSLRAGAFAVDDLSFTIPTGAYAVLMGRTGTGKTTILEAICGLKPVLAGSIRLNDVDVTPLRPAERGVGYVPQDLALFPTLSVYENLAFALRMRDWPDEAIAIRVDELADWMGVAHLLHRRPFGLSGGESQRVALGRALAFHPAVLLLDEPLSALDDETRADMYEVLHSVRARTGVTTLHVTHSLSEAKALGDRLLVLSAGSVDETVLQREPRAPGATGIVPGRPE